MKNRFELLIFDWDGTLFDSIDWIVQSLQYAAETCGMPEPSARAARSVIGLSLRHAMEGLYPGVAEGQAQRLMAAYYAHYNAKAPGPEGLFPGVAAMLERLRAEGFKLAVATGKGRKALAQVTAATGTAALFHAMRCAEETASKPDPAMLLQILAALEVAPERALMVGDSIHDLNMAANAGMPALAVSCGANERAELLALKPLACLEQTVELLELMGLNEGMKR
jgi:phosphoglycolate phosphatase